MQKIAIEDVHNAILEAAKNPKINKKENCNHWRIQRSRFGITYSSHYKDIKCVVGIVASHVTFPGNTSHFTTSTWTFQNKELPFVPVNEAAVPFLIKRNLRGAFEAMLKDSIAESKALIKVEKIKGSILLISATKDEICPSTPMAEKMIERLKSQKFNYYFEHVPIVGGHSEPLKHFDLVLLFRKNIL